MALSGCISTSPQEPFGDVRTDVRDRTGHDIAWGRFAEGAKEIDAAVAQLRDEPLTADAAVQTALLNNRRLQAVYGELGIAQADLVQAGLLRNPVFQGSLRWAPQSQRLFEFGVMQDFLDVLLVPLERAAARAELAAAKLRVTERVIELAIETRVAFYDYVANKQQLVEWGDVLLTSEAAYEMAQSLRAAGNIPELDMLNEQAAYERVKLQYARVEAQNVRHRERLNRLMGLWGESTRWEAVDVLPLLPDAAIESADIERRALAANLELERTLAEIEAVANRYRLREVTRILPELRLGGAIELEKEGTTKLVEHRRRDGRKYELKEVPGPTEIWAGPQFNVAIPIFDWGQAASAAGRAEVELRFERYAALAVEVRSAARELAYRAATAQQRAVYQRDVMIPLRAAITQETHLRYNAMFDGVFQLLRAKRGELDARLDAIDAIAEFWHAHARLEQLVMGGMPDEFREFMGEGRQARLGLMQGNSGSLSDEANESVQASHSR
jgi:cobalt-zinc-cadmium efflux system outer membrane protein